MKQIWNWLLSLFCKEEEPKKAEHVHQWEEMFKFSDSQKNQHTTFYKCVGCGQQKTE